MITTAMLNKLKEFGLNTYEAKTWAAVLMKGAATASILSELTGVPRSRCYDVLESLEKKGFIIAKVGRPMKYIAVTPEEAIERVKTQLQKEADDQIVSLEKLKESSIMKELKGLHSSGMESVAPQELTGVIKQKRNVDNHISSMIRNAKGEVLISTDAQDLITKAALLQNLLPALPKRPIVKILTQETTDTKRISKALKGLVEIKTTPHVGKFFVADNAATLFLSSDEDQSAIWVNSQEFVDSLKDAFQTKWASN